jgi:8-oxo-dGTP diphosphatase
MQVVAGLLVQEGRLLCCQRREAGPFALKWEFPGGKVERGESLPDALARELREELAIEIGGIKEILRHDHCYRDGTQVELIFFRVDGYRGEIVNKVFHDIRWAGVEELRRFDFLDGDRPLIEKLQREGLTWEDNR